MGKRCGGDDAHQGMAARSNAHEGWKARVGRRSVGMARNDHAAFTGGIRIGCIASCISFSFGSQVIDRLPLGINQLRKSKIGSNILKLAKNPPNGGKLFTIQTHLENRMRQESNVNACKVGTHSRYVVHERHVGRASARACQNLDPSYQLPSSPSLNLKFINIYVSNNCAFCFLFGWCARSIQ